MKFREVENTGKGSCYPAIDPVKTGAHLKNLVEQRGYTVKDIQRLLCLSCPQPVYRWFKGQVLPSVDHLYALSRLLYVHMEELLLPSSAPFDDKQHCSAWKDSAADGNAWKDSVPDDGSSHSSFSDDNAAKDVKSKRLAFYWMSVRRAAA